MCARDCSAMLDMVLAFFLPIPEFASSLDYSAYTRVAAHAPIKIDACEASEEKERGVVAHSTLEYGGRVHDSGREAGPARTLTFRFR